jgi:hypothetical protein
MQNVVFIESYHTNITTVGPQVATSLILGKGQTYPQNQRNSDISTDMLPLYS